MTVWEEGIRGVDRLLVWWRVGKGLKGQEVEVAMDMGNAVFALRRRS